MIQPIHPSGVDSPRNRITTSEESSCVPLIKVRLSLVWRRCRGVSNADIQMYFDGPSFRYKI
jgi:hypothetical protein